MQGALGEEAAKCVGDAVGCAVHVVEVARTHDREQRLVPQITGDPADKGHHRHPGSVVNDAPLLAHVNHVTIARVCNRGNRVAMRWRASSSAPSLSQSLNGIGIEKFNSEPGVSIAIAIPRPAIAMAGT